MLPEEYLGVSDPEPLFVDERVADRLCGLLGVSAVAAVGLQDVVAADEFGVGHAVGEAAHANADAWKR